VADCAGIGGSLEARVLGVLGTARVVRRDCIGSCPARSDAAQLPAATTSTHEQRTTCEAAA
jgi:hypothetical protein